MAEQLAGTEQVEDPACEGELHRARANHAQVLDGTGVLGEDHLAGGEELDLRRGRDALELVVAERIERRRAAESLYLVDRRAGGRRDLLILRLSIHCQPIVRTAGANDAPRAWPARNHRISSREISPQPERLRVRLGAVSRSNAKRAGESRCGPGTA